MPSHDFPEDDDIVMEEAEPKVVQRTSDDAEEHALPARTECEGDECECANSRELLEAEMWKYFCVFSCEFQDLASEYSGIEGRELAGTVDPTLIATYPSTLVAMLIRAAHRTTT